MTQTQNHNASGGAEMTPERQQELAIARRCFNSMERLTNQVLSYPPGHPAIESALENTYKTFFEYFQITDRLTVQVHPHSLRLLNSEEDVWETDEPRDYCFVLSRDGIFLIHILAGIDKTELKRFVEVLNFIIENRNDPNVQAATVFFEAGFRYISYDALDESLAALAGIDLDIRNRDTKEEKEEIEELFNDAFEKKEDEAGEQVDGNYEINVSNPSEKLRKIEVGSREFLTLDDEAQQHLLELRLGFTEHAELEHREGEMLSAILGAKPKAELRIQAVEQIGEVMGALLATNQPWEALTFLKLIHHWRDKFAPEVAHELKNIVSQCFDKRRNQELVRQALQADTKERRMILQMFNALHLDDPSASLAQVVGWDIDDEARQDILRYLKERSRYSFDFLEEAILDISDEYAAPIFEILESGMPRSRPILIKVLTAELTPPLKAKAMTLLRGTWSDPIEVRDLVVPLASSQHSELRIEACKAVAEATPQHIVRVMAPLFSDALRKRPEEEVRELSKLFVDKGGQAAVEKLTELVHRRGLTTSEQERELAVSIVRSLIRTPHPAVISMLDTVAKDWLVPQRIRSACKEIYEILKTGN
jgi:hypothetical protein